MTIDRRKFIRDSSLVLSAGALGVAGCSESQQQVTVTKEVAPAAAPDVDLLASYWTITGDVDPAGTGPQYSPFDFRERVEAISKVGFNGMGIWHTDLYHTMESRSLQNSNSCSTGSIPTVASRRNSQTLRKQNCSLPRRGSARDT
jgi:hypothetical protein